MIRTILYLAGVAVVIAAAVWMAGRPGEVSLTWQGWRVDTSVAVLVFIVAVIAAVAAILYRALVAVGHAPGQFFRSRRVRRRERGLRALTQGMVAVAAGDATEAARQARRADALLDDPPLTMLLSAQAAQLQGDEDAARRYFTAMLEREETAFLGLRGLLVQAERDGDALTARELVRRAHQLRPRAAWVLQSMLAQQAADRDWRAALRTLDEAVKAKAIDAADAAGQKSAILLALCDQSRAAGNGADALAYARSARDAAPGSLPAAIRFAHLQAEDGRRRRATRTIMEQWARAPHPDLARTLRDLTEGPALEKVRAMEKLAAQNPDHVESDLALAEAGLDASLWGTARNHLERAVRGAPTARACRLMAALEQGEHGDAEAETDWLRRAATARPDPAWLCGACGAESADWRPLCPNCGAFARIEWRAPDRAAARAIGAGDQTGEEPPGLDADETPRSLTARTDDGQ